MEKNNDFKNSELIENRNNYTVSKPKMYEIDFDKIKNFDDLIELIKAFDIVVYDNFVNFHKIKNYLKKVDMDENKIDE